MAGLVWVWRQWPSRLPRATRLRMAVVWVAAVGALAGSIGSISGRAALAWLGIEQLQWDSVQSTCHNGVVMEMMLELEHVVVHRPEGYSEDEIVRCAQARYAGGAQGATQGEPAESVNLIIYLVESMMDPLELGYAFTADPIPTVRASRRVQTGGYAIVPEVFYGSSSTEFELLTAMAMYFLPERSCPYKQYIKRKIPSLPWLLKERGYQTSAVMADYPSLFNRPEVFRHLGFDKVTWLYNPSGLPLDIAGRWVADKALVDVVIAQSRKPGPQFVFANPNSTHGPYNYPHYLGSDLDIVGPMEQSARDELKTYINAIHAADAAIAKLLSAMQRSDRKTVVVILGDHLPPLTQQEGIYSKAGPEQRSDLDLVRKRRQVPLVIWTNFGTPRKDLVSSVNFLPAHILATMGIRPRGFLALNEAFGSQLIVLLGYSQTAEGDRFARNLVPARLAGVFRDYELVQYDLLLGKQYVLRPLREAYGRP